MAGILSNQAPNPPTRHTTIVSQNSRFFLTNYDTNIRKVQSQLAQGDGSGTVNGAGSDGKFLNEVHRFLLIICRSLHLFASSKPSLESLRTKRNCGRRQLSYHDKRRRKRLWAAHLEHALHSGMFSNPLED